MDINFKPARSITPICVDSYSGKEFLDGFKSVLTVDEKQMPKLEKKLNTYFPD